MVVEALETRETLPSFRAKPCASNRGVAVGTAGIVAEPDGVSFGLTVARSSTVGSPVSGSLGLGDKPPRPVIVNSPCSLTPDGF